MKIDLNYLNRFNILDINQDFTLSSEFYKDTEIRKLENLHVEGTIEIDYLDDVNCNLTITGLMILPCAVTLKDVPYKFETNFEESLGKFEEIYKNNKNTLEISDILWENIVLEIPIRVVSKDIEPSNTSGDGWELISEE